MSVSAVFTVQRCNLSPPLWFWCLRRAPDQMGLTAVMNLRPQIHYSHSLFLWYITAKTCTLKGVKSRFLNIIFCHFENHTIGSKPNRCQQTQMHRMIHRQNVFLKKTFWLKKKQKHLFICSSQIYLYSAFRNTVNIVSKQLYTITII